MSTSGYNLYSLTCRYYVKFSPEPSKLCLYVSMSLDLMCDPLPLYISIFNFSIDLVMFIGQFYLLSNNNRIYLYIYSFIFLVLFSKRNECIF